MGSVYRVVEQKKGKGRYIYNREKLHKAGWEPKHKLKHRILQKEFFKQIKELGL